MTAQLSLGSNKYHQKTSYRIINMSYSTSNTNG